MCWWRICRSFTELSRLKKDIGHPWTVMLSFLQSDTTVQLLWRHNGCGSVSNHQPHGCLVKRLFRCRSKKTSKLRVTGLCAGNSPGTGEVPAQMDSNAENVSIWWRHHALSIYILLKVMLSLFVCNLGISSVKRIISKGLWVESLRIFFLTETSKCPYTGSVCKSQKRF